MSAQHAVRDAVTPRIAVGSIVQESNSFVAQRTDLALFENTYVYEGDEVLKLWDSVGEESGVLHTCASHGAEVVPLLAARSVPGGPLTDDCYRSLKGGLVARLRKAGLVDGVCLSMHGSMTTDSEGDPEGDVLEAVRDVVGQTVPIAVTLDLHANVTERMLRAATIIVSYAHYPHDDAYSTGERAASLLLKTVPGEVRPVMALAKVPLLASGCNGQTSGDYPMAYLTRRARELEEMPGVLSVSCCQVHPYNDLPDLGCAGLVVTDGDPALAAREAGDLAERFWSRRFEFEPKVSSVAEAVELGRAVNGPVVLVDAADCAGGGAAGDSVSLLRELLLLGVVEPSYTMVVDPVAARACAEAGVNGRVTVSIGHGIDPAWGQPLLVSGRVQAISDGRFRYTGGPFGGTMASMGLSAVLECGSAKVLITSMPTYDWMDEQYRSVGMDPRMAKFIGAKNPMNYRMAYREIAKASFVVDLPGPTPAHVRHLKYKSMRRPYFPLDEHIPGLPILVVLSGGQV